MKQGVKVVKRGRIRNVVRGRTQISLSGTSPSIKQGASIGHLISQGVGKAHRTSSIGHPILSPSPTVGRKTIKIVGRVAATSPKPFGTLLTSRTRALMTPSDPKHKLAPHSPRLMSPPLKNSFCFRDEPYHQTRNEHRKWRLARGRQSQPNKLDSTSHSLSLPDDRAYNDRLSGGE